MKILFFSPFADINKHAIPEALVANELQKEGNKIFYVSCSGLLNGICNCMFAKGLNINEESSQESKEKVCVECKIKSSNIINIFKFEKIILDNFISFCDRRAALQSIYKNKKLSLEKIKFKEIPVGKFAAYEFCLQWKLNRLTLNKQEREKYEKHLLNCILTSIAMEKILLKVAPQKIVLYNGNYSINRTVIELGKKLNIPYISIHGGNHIKYRYESLTFERNLSYQYLQNTSAAWKKTKLNPLTKKEKEFACKHISAWKEGKDLWVYSEPPRKNALELRQSLKIKLNSKVVTVLLSSFDERFAASLSGSIPRRINKMFKCQKEWIRYIFQLAKCNAETFFIIRIHPREYSNKRECVTSKNETYYKQLQKNCLKNIWINTPDQKISLHDIIQITDLALNQTSTTGLECLYNGVPVLGTDPQVLFAYPPEFNYYAKTKDEYTNLIYTITTPKVNKEMIEKWIWFKTTDNCVYMPNISYNDDSIYNKIIKNIRFLRANKEIYRALIHFRHLFKLQKKIKSISTIQPLLRFIKQ